MPEMIWAWARDREGRKKRKYEQLWEKSPPPPLPTQSSRCFNFRAILSLPVSFSLFFRCNGDALVLFFVFFSLLEHALRFNTFPWPCFHAGEGRPLHSENTIIGSVARCQIWEEVNSISSLPVPPPPTCSGMKCASHYCSRSVQQAADRSCKTDRRSNLSTIPLVWAPTLLLSLSFFLLYNSYISQGLLQSPCFLFLKGPFAAKRNPSSDPFFNHHFTQMIDMVFFWMMVIHSWVVVVHSTTKGEAKRSKRI